MIAKIAIFCKNFLDWFKSDRCFVSHFIKAFPLANNLLVLTILMLAIFVVTLYMIIAAQTGVRGWISLLVIILLSSTFASGFFYLIKTNVDKMFNNETIEKSNIKQTFADLYTGIGENYLKFLGMFVMFFVLATLVIFLTVLFIDKFLFPLAKLGNNLADFFAILAYPSQMDSVMQNMDAQQKIMLKEWSRSFLITTQTFTFLVMLWIPEVLYSGKNIFISLFSSIKKVVCDFPNALCVYLTITLLNYLLAILLVFTGNSFVLFLLNIASLYLLIYNFYAIFIYYNTKYIHSNDRDI